MFEWWIKIQNSKDSSPMIFITMQVILFSANKIECGVMTVLKFSVSGFLFLIAIFSFCVTGNVSKQAKVKVLKNEEDILFYAWMLTLYKYFISVFIFLSNMMSDWNSFKSVKHLILLVVVQWPTLISSPDFVYEKMTCILINKFDSS